MGWVLDSNASKTLGCVHNLQRTIEYRFTGKDRFDNTPWIPKPRVGQAGDEIVFHCPFGCEPVVILVANRKGGLEEV